MPTKKEMKSEFHPTHQSSVRSVKRFVRWTQMSQKICLRVANDKQWMQNACYSFELNKNVKLKPNQQQRKQESVKESKRFEPNDAWKYSHAFVSIFVISFEIDKNVLLL